MAQELTPRSVKDAILQLSRHRGVQTPFLLLDANEIISRATNLKKEVSSRFKRNGIFFSYKTNNISFIMQLLAGVGFGAEVASLEELLSAEFDGTASVGVIFDGPLKLERELAYAIRSNAIIHIDSLSEARLAARLSREAGSASRARFGIRLAHYYGDRFSRFGFTPHEIEKFNECEDCRSLSISGIHVHAGSNISNIDLFKDTFIRNRLFIRDVVSRTDAWIDVGGGFPANSKRADNNYNVVNMLNDLKEFFVSESICPETRILFEPGRYICEDSGYLISQIAHFKAREDRTIGVCDAGINLVRSVRSWQHSAETLFCGPSPTSVDIYGSNCFEEDRVWIGLQVDPNVEGQFVVIRGCGAYDIPSTTAWLRVSNPIFVLLDGNLTEVRMRPDINAFRSLDMSDGR